MPRAPSGRRYAQAVFQIASETDKLEEWALDLGALASALESPDLSGLLDAPQVPAAQKLEAIRQVLNSIAGPLAINLVSILAIRNLVHLVPDVLDEYGRLLDSHRGIERAEVATAVPLDDGQRTRIADILRGIVGKEVRLNAVVEPEILGGLVARVGDRVADGSARAKLEKMRRSIVERA